MVLKGSEKTRDSARGATFSNFLDSLALSSASDYKIYSEFFETKYYLPITLTPMVQHVCNDSITK